MNKQELIAAYEAELIKLGSQLEFAQRMCDAYQAELSAASKCSNISAYETASKFCSFFQDVRAMQAKIDGMSKEMEFVKKTDFSEK